MEKHLMSNAYRELDFKQTPMVWHLPNTENVLYCDKLYIRSILEHPCYLQARLYEVDGIIAKEYAQCQYRINVLGTDPYQSMRISTLADKLTLDTFTDGGYVLKCIMNLPIDIIEVAKGPVIRKHQLNSVLEPEFVVKKIGGLDAL